VILPPIKTRCWLWAKRQLVLATITLITPIRSKLSIRRFKTTGNGWLEKPKYVSKSYSKCFQLIHCFIFYIGTQAQIGRFLFLVSFPIRFPRFGVVDPRHESQNRCRRASQGCSRSRSFTWTSPRTPSMLLFIVYIYSPLLIEYSIFRLQLMLVKTASVLRRKPARPFWRKKTGPLLKWTRNLSLWQMRSKTCLLYGRGVAFFTSNAWTSKYSIGIFPLILMKYVS